MKGNTHVRPGQNKEATMTRRSDNAAGQQTLLANLLISASTFTRRNTASADMVEAAADGCLFDASLAHFPFSPLFLLFSTFNYTSQL